MSNIQGQHEARNGEQPDFQVVREVFTSTATHTAPIINDPVLDQGNRILATLDELRQGVADFRQEIYVRQADLWREIPRKYQDLSLFRKQLDQVQKVVDDIHESVVPIQEDLGNFYTELNAFRTVLMPELQSLRAEISQQ